MQGHLGGGNSNICYVHSYLGKISNLANIFEMGWFNHQPVILGRTSKVPTLKRITRKHHFPPKREHQELIDLKLVPADI